MSYSTVFPSAAFTKQRSLSSLFGMRTYRAEDVLHFRGSVHFLDFDNVGTAQTFTIATLHADRERPEDDFCLRLSCSRPEIDELRHVFTNRNGSIEKSPALQKVEAILQAQRMWPQSNAVFKLLELEDILREAPETKLTLSHPRAEIGLRLCDSIHVSVAREIFNHACRQSEVQYLVDHSKLSHTKNPGQFQSLPESGGAWLACVKNPAF